MVPYARCDLRREQVATGGLEEFQHRLVFERGRVGEVDHHLRTGQGLLEPLASDGVDAAMGRGGEDLVSALTQNGDGLRADQAGAADDDDFHSLPSLVDDWRPSNANTQDRKNPDLNARVCKPAIKTNTDASVRNTPLTVPNSSKRGSRGICSLAKCSGSQAFSVLGATLN